MKSVRPYVAGEVATPATLSLVVASLVTAWLASASLEAQVGQYTLPGGLLEDESSTQEQIEKGREEARWRLGPLRLQPELSLRDLSYVSDAFSGSGQPEVSDFTVTAGAGLHGYLPLGSDSTLALFARPEYVWWQDLEERRRGNLSFGAGVFSYFNRLRLELEGTRQEIQSLVTSELEQAVTTRLDELGLLVELRVARPLWIFAGARQIEYRFLTEDDDGRLAAFERLDRDEDVLRAGVRLELGRDWSMRVGVEETETNFVGPGEDLSSSGTSAFLDLHFEGNRFELHGGIAARSLDPEPGSSLTPFEDETGNLQVGLELRPRLNLVLYGLRDLSYAVSTGNTTFVRDRQGIGWVWELGRRTMFSAFAETGEDDYERSGGALLRVDDLSAYGAQVRFELRESISFQIGFSHSEYDSNDPRFDREVDRVTTGITVSGGSWP